MIPLVASVADLPAAIAYAQDRPQSRWFVSRRAHSLDAADQIPAEWGDAITAASGSPSTDEMAALGKKGQALRNEDGSYSYPTRNRGELAKAFQAYGRARNKVAAKRYLLRRARSLHATDLIPDSWKPLRAAAAPADKTYRKQLKAGAILEGLFVQYPNHPGLAHYIIHTYDVPPLASRAVGAAQRYGEIAPSTPHALHMPSHTFTRVGDWQNSIDANIAAATTARSEGQASEELHASDYMVYAYLQTAQDAAARHLVDSAIQIFSRFDPGVLISGAASPAAAYFAYAAIPARYCLERHAWADAAAVFVFSLAAAGKKARMEDGE